MLNPGDRFDRYTIEAVLGEGGMGVVYRAVDEKLGRGVALKLLRVEPNATLEKQSEGHARLLREARAAAALAHPNAISVFDVGEHDGAPFIAMELVDGRSLRRAMEDPSADGPRRLRWLVDVARALAAAHEVGLVHRDVKPENVLVRRDDAVKVLDFGIARRSAAAVDASAPTKAPVIPTLTVQGTVVGTPLYMAPEQIRGDALDGRSDQFTWAVMAYEVLAGRVPWRAPGDPLALAASILTDEPEPLRSLAPHVPPAVAAVIERAMAKRAEDRFASMAEVVAALEPYTMGHSSSPASNVPPESAARASSPRRSTPAPVSPYAATDLRRYSNEQMQAIVGRALQHQRAAATGIGHGDLLEVARELGVDEQAVHRAADELAIAARMEAGLADDRARAKRKLLRNAATAAVVITFLALMFRASWVQWVVYGWGISLALQAVNYFFPKEQRRPSTRRSPDPSFEREVEEGAQALLRATETRARVRVPTAQPAPRMRVDAAQTGEAEREAIAAAEAAPPRERLRGP